MTRINATEFIEENLKTIFAYALSRVSDRDDAEDLTNDIVVAILQSAGRLKDPDAFYGYIWGIAANTYKKFMMRKSRIQFDRLDENALEEADFTESLLGQEDVIRLRREIALLSKEYRECTVAYYFDGLPCAEISKRLGISLGMVKHYLFKTRKILKEGICMEREFGKKSFKPAPFRFVTIYSGNHNPEYQNLFARKLPGQILLSAYYTPMAVRELAIELGVASVYLEDEIALLEKYQLIEKLPSGKYQTRLVIFTDDFTNEFHKSARKFLGFALSEMLDSLEGKCTQLRNINAICEKLPKSRLLWGLLWPAMHQARQEFLKRYPQYQDKPGLYDGATGINYGIVDDGSGCDAFAGYAGLDGDYYVSAADFSVLPENNRYFANRDDKAFRRKIDETVSGKMEPEFMVFTEAEEKVLFEILEAEVSLMADIYGRLFSLASQLMHGHAPKMIDGMIDRILFQTLFFRTVDLIGDCAVESGALTLPDFDGPVALYVRENTEAAQAKVNQNVQI